ncbi:MAG: ureidoglycolate lyase [Syntrophomonadaceae bacterium]
MKISPEHITKENFEKFGSVVTFPEGKPTSEAKEYKFWSDIASYHIDGDTEIGICTVFKQPENEISAMERHLDTPEILIPIDAPFTLPLLLEGSPEEDVKAFQVNVGEAVVIKGGVWHGACLPVKAEKSSYFVIFRRRTPHEDVEEKKVSTLEITE